MFSYHGVKHDVMFRRDRQLAEPVAYFNLPHLHFGAPVGVTPNEFSRDLWYEKTRVPGLSCGLFA